METIFYVLAIIGIASGVFALLAGLAHLCAWLCDD